MTGTWTLVDCTHEKWRFRGGPLGMCSLNEAAALEVAAVGCAAVVGARSGDAASQKLGHFQLCEGSLDAQPCGLGCRWCTVMMQQPCNLTLGTAAFWMGALSGIAAAWRVTWQNMDLERCSSWGHAALSLRRELSSGTASPGAPLNDGVLDRAYWGVHSWSVQVWRAQPERMHLCGWSGDRNCCASERWCVLPTQHDIVDHQH